MSEGGEDGHPPHRNPLIGSWRLETWVSLVDDGTEARPMGARPEGHGELRVGYFARVAPVKVMQELDEAYRVLRKEKGLAKSRLVAAGYLG